MWLELENVVRRFGARSAVNGLSMRLAKGSIGCLLGPEWLRQDDGVALYRGFRAGRCRCDSRARSRARRLEDFHSPPESRQIGMVFQDYALFPHLTVLDNVAFGLHRLDRSKRKRRAEEILGNRGLGGAPEPLPASIVRRSAAARVALGTSVGAGAEIVLLDEPFSSLDVELRERLSIEVRYGVEDAQHDGAAGDSRSAGSVRGRRCRWRDEGRQAGAVGPPYQLYHRPRDALRRRLHRPGRFIPGEIVAAGSVRTELGVVRANGNGAVADRPSRRSAVTARRCHS